MSVGDAGLLWQNRGFFLHAWSYGIARANVEENTRSHEYGENLANPLSHSASGRGRTPTLSDRFLDNSNGPAIFSTFVPGAAEGTTLPTRSRAANVGHASVGSG